MKIARTMLSKSLSVITEYHDNRIVFFLRLIHHLNQVSEERVRVCNGGQVGSVLVRLAACAAKQLRGATHDFRHVFGQRRIP
jgi:hypothetical protein